MAKKKSRRSATTPAHLAARIKKLQARIRKWKTDCLLITNPLDIDYLTGFCGEDSWAIVPARGSKVHVLSDSRFTVEIAEDAPQVNAIIREGISLTKALKQLAEQKGYKRFAIQPGYISLSLKKAMDKEFTPRQLKVVDDGLLQQRAIKDKLEIDLLQKAVKIQQDGMRATLTQIKPGMTELQIQAILHYEMGKRGASGPAFDSIIAADANAAKPHATPGDAKVKKNGIVLIDWGAKYKGYHSDMTRVYALGKWPAKIEEIYKIVREAQLAGIAAIKPGARLKDVDKAARDIIDKAGYRENYRHSLGHGIGLQVHEQPGFGPKSKGVLQVDQVVTVEPGIYLPGIGGVRLEDDVLVTPKGHKVLCNLPTTLKSAII